MIRIVFIAFLLLGIMGVLTLWVLVATDPGDNLTVISSKMTQDSSGTLIEAFLKNNTEKAYSDIEVEVMLLDEENESLNRVTRKTEKILAGETWSFRIEVEEKGVTDFRIISINTAEEVIRRH